MFSTHGGRCSTWLPGIRRSGTCRAGGDRVSRMASAGRLVDNGPVLPALRPLTARRPARVPWICCGVSVAAAGVLAVWPDQAADVERIYSAGLFPRLQHGVTWLSNLSPFSWLDAAIGGLVAWVAWGVASVVRSPHTSRRQTLAQFVCRAATVACLAYVAFVLLWGLNYRRAPLVNRLAFDDARVTDDAVLAFAGRAVVTVNGLAEAGRHDARQGDHWAAVAGRLRRPFADTLRDLGLPDARPARPKTPWAAVYFNATGVSGMTNPFGLETLVASNLLPVERPAVLAHEWAHLAGIGAESDASFVGFLVCARGDAMARYGGWLDVTVRALRVVPHAERSRLIKQLGPLVMADIDAIAARNERDQVAWLGQTAWNLYDRYLKANRVAEGVRSYDRVVALLVGTEFEAEWTPRRR